MQAMSRSDVFAAAIDSVLAGAALKKQHDDIIFRLARKTDMSLKRKDLSDKPNDRPPGLISSAQKTLLESSVDLSALGTLLSRAQMTNNFMESRPKQRKEQIGFRIQYFLRRNM